MSTFFMIIWMGLGIICCALYNDEYRKRTTLQDRLEATNIALADLQDRLDTAYKALDPQNRLDESKRQLLQHALTTKEPV